MPANTSTHININIVTIRQTPKLAMFGDVDSSQSKIENARKIENANPTACVMDYPDNHQMWRGCIIQQCQLQNECAIQNCEIWYPNSSEGLLELCQSTVHLVDVAVVLVRMRMPHLRTPV